MNQTQQPQKPKKSKVNGVILIDKPKGMTSQQVVSKVKYLFMSTAHNSKKAGHTGTLDPMATGLLPICMGEATKFSHYQLEADKSYQAIIKLGEQTDTGDTEGQIIATKDLPQITDEILTQVCQQFTGDIMQIPPMYSALKKDGKKLYEYAREGQEVERPPRPLNIKELTLSPLHSDQSKLPDQLQLTVTCSKGTYVRVLGEDIAIALGSVGHLIALRRIAVGAFDVTDAITLDKLENLAFETRFDKLLNVDVCLGDMPIIELDDSQVKRIHNGQRLNVYQQVNKSWFDDTNMSNDVHTDSSEDLTTSRDVRLYATTNKVFVGLASLEKGGRLQPTKVVNIS